MPENHTNEKYAYRLRPCPAYDAECLEGWLTDLAGDGLLLSQDGFFFGFGIFQKTKPQTVKYRLLPVSKAASIFDTDREAPDSVEQMLRREYGWEYVARQGDFYIYRSVTPYARDMPTDRETQERELHVLRKQQRSSIFTSIFTGLIFSMALDGRLLQSFFYLGTWRSLFALTVLLSFLISSVSRAIHYGRLTRQLLEDDWFRPDRPRWQERAPRHYLLLCTKILSVTALVIMLLTMWAADMEGDSRFPIAGYEGDPPFAAIADLAGEAGSFIRDDSDFLDANSYQEWSDPLAQCILDWHDSGIVYRGNGAVTNVSLYIDYYETAFPWLAYGLAREYWWADWLLNRKYEEVPLPSADELGVDYAIAYQGHLIFPTIILQKDCRIYHVYYSQHPAATDHTGTVFTAEELAAIMAAALE